MVVKNSRFLCCHIFPPQKSSLFLVKAFMKSELLKDLVYPKVHSWDFFKDLVVTGCLNQWGWFFGVMITSDHRAGHDPWSNKKPTSTQKKKNVRNARTKWSISNCLLVTVDHFFYLPLVYIYSPFKPYTRFFFIWGGSLGHGRGLKKFLKVSFRKILREEITR